MRFWVEKGELKEPEEIIITTIIKEEEEPTSSVIDLSLVGEWTR